MNEDQLIDQLTRSWSRKNKFVHTGVGDDCALLQPISKTDLLVLKTDAMVDNVHFTTQMPARQIGHKAIARVISDFAAMGAQPLAAVISVGVPKKFLQKFLKKCYEGLEKTATRFGISLVGGETTRSDQLWFCVSATGRVKKSEAVLRSTAKKGDLIFVTGKLGGSFKSRRHLRFEPRLEEGQWLAQHHFASAMMDLSDGLGKGLPRLAHSSKCSFRLHTDQIPIHKNCTIHQAVNDGEDYELLFTVPPARVQKLLASWHFKTPITPIGTIFSISHPPQTQGIPLTGFDHFNS